MLTPKHTGFIHTVLYLKSQRKLLKFDYNCPPPESLLRVQLAEHQGVLCHKMKDVYQCRGHAPCTKAQLSIGKCCATR